jgi:death-on-curing protein
MNPPIGVRRDVVLAFHDLLLAEHGGKPGIRDVGLLDSALSRPENLFGYGEPGLFDLAASYAFRLVKNHPFIDGNKRMGFAVATLFLELNNLYFFAPEVEVVLNTLALAAGEMSEAAYAEWMKMNSKRA